MKTSTNTTVDAELTIKGLELIAKNEQFHMDAHQIHESCQNYLDSLGLKINLYEKITISCTPRNNYSTLRLSCNSTEMPFIRHKPKKCFNCDYNDCNNCNYQKEKSYNILTPSLFREVVKIALTKAQEEIRTKESALLPWQSEGLPSPEEITKLRRQVEDRIRKDTKALIYCLKVLG